MAANNQPVCLPSQATTQSSLCNHLQTNYSDAVGDEHGQDNLPSSPPDISAPAESRPNDSSSHDDCGWGTHNTQYNDQAIDQAWGPFGFEAAQVDTMQGNGMWDQPLEETMQMNTWEPVDPHVHAYQAGFEPANTQPYATMNTGMPGGTSYNHADFQNQFFDGAPDRLLRLERSIERAIAEAAQERADIKSSIDVLASRVDSSYDDCCDLRRRYYQLEVDVLQWSEFMTRAMARLDELLRASSERSEDDE